MNSTFTLRRYLLSATTLALAVTINGQASADIWQDLSSKTFAAQAKSAPLTAQPKAIRSARRLNLNVEELKYTLNQAPGEHFGASSTQIELPLPSGEMRLFTLYHSPIMEQSLSDQNPDIQTYKIVDVLNPLNSGRLDLTPEGFHGIFSHDGDTVYIDPIGKTGQYQSYFRSDYMSERGSENATPLNCGFKGEASPNTNSNTKNQTPLPRAQSKFSFGTDLRTYRIAIAATGEFSQFHGGTKEGALAAIVTGLNRVNQVYEREVAIKLELVANTDIIYLDGATDPFTDDNSEELIFEVGTELNAKVGVANYDIGHVFSTGGGGLAGFGVVCGQDKSEGVTGSEEPVNDPFFIDFVAHEIGHQFQGNHTFNGNANSCEDNGERTAAYEPGSGSTIMGYAMLCDEENIQAQSDDYFHTHSLTQISEFIADTAKGGSCGVSTTLNNTPPVSIPGADGHIPQSTPFILTGDGTDADAGDTLTYTWEQYDLGTITNTKAEFVDDGSRPIFRSFPPQTSKSRTFPQISDILTGTTTYGELLPTTNRDLNFRLTVRDGKGGAAAEIRKLTVNNAAGPFVVTAPAAATWTGGGTETITWDVANTTAAPISCANVEITLSTDAGQTFGTTLLASTPNDGSQAITVPDVDTTTGRLRIKCATQPFFAVNSAAIAISSSGGGSNTAPVANADVFTVEADSASTNFTVLGNDTDADSDTLTITGVSAISAGGTVTVNGTQIAYQPAAGFSGTETFTYAISDGNTGTASAQVTVTVNAAAPTNTAPVANDDSFTVDEDSSATDLDVLNNDTDAENDTLTISSISGISNGGTASINGNVISYQPASGFSGSETFTYVIGDGTDTSNSATVTVDVTATPAPAPTPTPPSTGGGGGGGGGGSFGIFMLLILGAARKLKAVRRRRFSRDVAG